MKKYGRRIVDTMTKLEVDANKKGESSPLLVRMESNHFAPESASDLKWDFIAVLDLQSAGTNAKEWGPWVIEKRINEEAKIECEQEAAERQARKEREEAQAKAEKEREAAIEAAKWRTWTDASGKHKIEATFGGMISGKVKLIERDGSAVRLPLEKLSDSDQKWIANRQK